MSCADTGTKRLEDSAFKWPAITDGVIRLTAAQLSALLEGPDWRRVHEARTTRTPEAGRFYRRQDFGFGWALGA
nr:transposase [Consotaella salsifontis]